VITYPIIFIKVAIDLIDLNKYNWRSAGVASTANSGVPQNAGNGVVSQPLSAGFSQRRKKPD
jgi:hypothetical protein